MSGLILSAQALSILPVEPSSETSHVHCRVECQADTGYQLLLHTHVPVCSGGPCMPIKVFL